MIIIFVFSVYIDCECHTNLSNLILFDNHFVVLQCVFHCVYILHFACMCLSCAVCMFCPVFLRCVCVCFALCMYVYVCRTWWSFLRRANS